jgi:hypothetical protein
MTLKLLRVLLVPAMLVLVTASPAFAASHLPPGNDGGRVDTEVGGEQVQGPAVAGEVVSAPGGTAFTGTDISVGAVLMVGLLGAGVVLLSVGRRRRSPAA